MKERLAILLADFRTTPQDLGIPAVDLDSGLPRLLQMGIVVAGMAAVIFLIIGGLMYATSAGDPTRLSRAKMTLFYAIAGLLIAITAFALVQFTLQGLTKGAP